MVISKYGTEENDWAAWREKAGRSYKRDVTRGIESGKGCTGEMGSGGWRSRMANGEVGRVTAANPFNIVRVPR